MREHEPNVTDLGEVLGVTQQAVGKMLRQMEMMGYLVVEQLEEDRRNRVITLTKKGHRLLAVADRLSHVA